jgi:Fe-S-cluster containining protein
MKKISFKCYNCGRCCRNLLFEDQGIVNGLSLRTKKEAELFPKEMVFPSFGIGLDPNDLSKPKKIVSYQLGVNDCPFISDSNVCELYEKRPLVCRGFPLMSMGKLGVSITSADKCLFVEKVEHQIGSLTSFLPMTTNKIKAVIEWKAISRLSSNINKFIIEPTLCGKAIWKFNLSNKKWIRQR